MSLVRTSLLNAIAVAVKVGVAMVLNKILAVYVGPAGYAAIGQFQSVLGIAASLAGGVLGPGITKGTAEHYEDESKQRAVWQTALKLTLIAAGVISLILLFAGKWLGAHLLQRQDMNGVFIGLAVALPAIAVNNYFLAILNGKKDVPAYVSANVFGSVFSLIVVGILTYTLGLYGALLGIAVSPAMVLMATAALVFKRPWMTAAALWGKMDTRAVRELSGFGLMGLTSAMLAPLAYIYIRDFLAAQLGLHAAGYWQASWKISEIYLMLITLTLSVYYLPRLAEISIAAELKTEILKVYRYVLPIVMIGAIIIYVLRDFIVRTLFSADFAPMRDLFFWQVIGDVLKIGSWILSYVMLGRAMVKPFIITEVIFAVTFCIFTNIFVRVFGLQGVAMAYAMNYAIYWFVIFYLVREEMIAMPSLEKSRGDSVV